MGLPNNSGLLRPIFVPLSSRGSSPVRATTVTSRLRAAARAPLFTTQYPSDLIFDFNSFETVLREESPSQD